MLMTATLYVTPCGGSTVNRPCHDVEVRKLTAFVRAQYDRSDVARDLSELPHARAVGRQSESPVLLTDLPSHRPRDLARRALLRRERACRRRRKPACSVKRR